MKSYYLHQSALSNDAFELMSSDIHYCLKNGNMLLANLISLLAMQIFCSLPTVNELVLMMNYVRVLLSNDKNLVKSERRQK